MSGAVHLPFAFLGVRAIQDSGVRRKANPAKTSTFGQAEKCAHRGSMVQGSPVRVEPDPPYRIRSAAMSCSGDHSPGGVR